MLPGKVGTLIKAFRLAKLNELLSALSPIGSCVQEIYLDLRRPQPNFRRGIHLLPEEPFKLEEVLADEAHELLSAKGIGCPANLQVPYDLEFVRLLLDTVKCATALDQQRRIIEAARQYVQASAMIEAAMTRQIPEPASHFLHESRAQFLRRVCQLDHLGRRQQREQVPECQIEKSPDAKTEEELIDDSAIQLVEHLVHGLEHSRSDILQHPDRPRVRDATPVDNGNPTLDHSVLSRETISVSERGTEEMDESHHVSPAAVNPSQQTYGQLDLRPADKEILPQRSFTLEPGNPLNLIHLVPGEALRCFLNLIIHSLQAWVARRVVNVFRNLLKKLRSRPTPPGTHRVRWKCQCGIDICDDYIELRSGGVARLQGVLESMAYQCSLAIDTRDDVSKRSYTL